MVYNSVFSNGARRLVHHLGHTGFTGRGIRVFGPHVSIHCSRRRIISRSTGTVHSAPISSTQGVLLVASSISVINVSRTRFFSSNVVRIYHRLTSDNIQIVITKLSVSCANGPFNPVPTLVTATRCIAGIRTVYIHYNGLTRRSRHLARSRGLIVLNRASSCRTVYHRYFGRLIQGQGRAR